MKLSLVLLALALSAQPAVAQRFLVAQATDPPAVFLVDTNAGAIFDFEFIDVAATAIPVPTEIWDAELVASEIWVTASDRVYRYDAASQNFLGSIALGGFGTLRGMEVVGTTVWIAAGSALLELTTGGVLLSSQPATDAYDVMEWNGELLVSKRALQRIDRHDLSGQLLGVFATGPVFSPFYGVLDLVPGQLAVRSNGNVLVESLRVIAEFDSSGAHVESFQAGIFEQGVQETADGRLLVTNAVGATIVVSSAPASSSILTFIPGIDDHQMRFISPFDAGDGSSSSYCQGAPNSAGPGAHTSALGTFRLSASSPSFTLVTTGVPLMDPGVGLYVYGSASAQLPFGDGFLCISPSPAAFRLGPIDVISTIVTKVIDFGALPPGGSITAGSTWSFQLLFRDGVFGGAGFNGSDAARITFQP